MPAENPVPHELAEAAAAFADAFSERLTGQLAELADAFADRRTVRVAPSDRWAPLTVGVPTDEPDRIVPYQADRLRVTITNTGGVPVALGNGPELSTTTSTRHDLAAGDSLTLDTRAAVFAIAGTTGAEVSLIFEESDQ